MKLRKILSLSLVIVLVVCTLSVSGVYAASPVIFDGTTHTVFDQSFGGHSSASDLTDFTVSGTWNYEKHFMITNGGTPSIISKSNYDVSDAEEWTFTTKQSCTYNGYYIKLAYDETNSKGYVLAYSRPSQTLALFRDTGYGYASGAYANAVAYVSLDAYGTDTTITVKYVKDTNTLTVKNSVNSNVITYTPDDGYVPNLNGKFGIQGANCGIFTVFNMKLEKSSGDITVNNWRYEKTFSTNDTVSSLAEEGITFNWDSPVINSNSVQFNNPNHTYAFNYKPAKQNFEGDYAVEFKASKATTYHNVKFNKIDDSNYYEMIAYRSYADANMGNVIITKYETGKDPVEIYNGSYGSVYIPNSVTLTYRLSFKTVDGILNIGVYISDGSKTCSFDAVDESPFAESGYLSVHGASTSNLYYIKAWSLASEGETTENVKYSENLLDAQFTANDTVAGVKEKYGITLYEKTTFTDGLATYNGTTYATISVPEFATSDNYNFEVKHKRGSNTSWIAWGYSSCTSSKVTSGYKISIPRYQNYYQLIKTDSSGTETVVATATRSSGNFYTANNQTFVFNVTMSKQSDGSVNIDVTVTNSNTGVTLTMETYNDTTPYAFNEKIFVYGQTLSYAKASATYTETIGGDATSYNGIFYKDAGENAIKEMVKGPVYFRHPTAVLNDHIAVAVLYEDHKMTDMKTFDPAELYNETVRLFDTTNSTAEDIKIRVYFFDSDETLNKLTEVYELK